MVRYRATPIAGCTLTSHSLCLGLSATCRVQQQRARGPSPQASALAPPLYLYSRPTTRARHTRPAGSKLAIQHHTPTSRGPVRRVTLACIGVTCMAPPPTHHVCTLKARPATHTCLPRGPAACIGPLGRPGGGGGKTADGGGAAHCVSTPAPRSLRPPSPGKGGGGAKGRRRVCSERRAVQAFPPHPHPLRARCKM